MRQGRAHCRGARSRRHSNYRSTPANGKSAQPLHAGCPGNLHDAPRRWTRHARLHVESVDVRHITASQRADALVSTDDSRPNHTQQVAVRIVYSGMKRVPVREKRAGLRRRRVRSRRQHADIADDGRRREARAGWLPDRHSSNDRRRQIFRSSDPAHLPKFNILCRLPNNPRPQRTV